MERRRGVESGSLHVGAGTTPGTYLLPRLLGEFHDSHPEIELRLEVAPTETIVELIRRGELHLGVVGEAVPHKDIERRPLIEDRLLCIAPPDGPSRMTRDDFAAETLIVRKAGSSSQAVSDEHLASNRLAPSQRLEVDSPEAIKQAVRAGLGIAFVSDLIVGDELADGRLHSVEIEGVTDPRRTLDLVRSAQHPLSPPERAFVELLDERLPAR
jgi:DNA-binding transcriptional LysR family regulator